MQALKLGAFALWKSSMNSKSTFCFYFLFKIATKTSPQPWLRKRNIMDSRCGIQPYGYILRSAATKKLDIATVSLQIFRRYALPRQYGDVQQIIYKAGQWQRDRAQTPYSAVRLTDAQRSL
jgi:hypothetical protein